MSFLFPMALWGLLALSIPIALHLLRRSNAKEEQWAAMQFLLARDTLSVKRHSIKEWLLLICRLLVFTFLVLALAKPVGEIWSLGDSEPDTVFLLLDRSAEMGRQNGTEEETFLEAAVLKMVEELSERKKIRVYLVDSAALEGTPILAPDSLPLLGQVSQTQIPCSVPQLISKAVSIYEEGGYGKTEFWLYTTAEERSWKRGDLSWDSLSSSSELISGITLRTFINKPAVMNDLRMSAITLDQYRDTLQLSVHLDGDHQDDRSIPLKVNWSDGVEEVISLDLDGKRDEYLISLNARACASGVVRLPEDCNEHNQAVAFSVGPPETVNVLIVTPEQMSDYTGNFTRAVEIQSKPHLNADWVAPSDFTITDLTPYSLVIWGADGDADKRELLENYMKNGGEVLVFPRLSQKRHGAGWFFQGIEEADTQQFFTVKDWNLKDGPWRNTEAGESLPLMSYQAILRAQIEVDGMTALAYWEDGQAALLRHFIGSGVLYTSTSIPHQSWSNMENLGLHLVMIQRVLDEISLKKGGSRMKTLTTGGQMQSVGLRKKGEHLIAYNRPLSRVKGRLEKGEIKQLLGDTGFRTKSLSSHYQRSVVQWFLVAVAILLMCESALLWGGVKKLKGDVK